MKEGLCCILLLLVSVSSSSSSLPTTCDDWRAVSRTGVTSFVSTFAPSPLSTFLEWSNDTTTDAQYWNTFVALHALARALELGVAPSGAAAFLESFVEWWAERGWFSAYFDDMDWAIEALVRTSNVLTDGAAKNKTADALKLLAALVESAWDDTCCGATPGGYWWDAKHSYKACASNAGTAMALCEYHMATGDARALQGALLGWGYWHEHMLNNETFQCADGIGPNGNTSWNIWTYNQGMMIGASTCLYAATGRPDFLTLASNILHKFVAQRETSAGGVLVEQQPCKYDDLDCLEFCGITFRFIARYLHVRKDDVAAAVLKASVNSILRFTTDGTRYPNTWTGPALPAGEALSLSSQTSALIAILEWTGLVCSGKV